MVGLAQLNVKHAPVYFGHPPHFWEERKRLEMKTKVDIEDMKKLSDIVEYDSLHLQNLIINKTSEKVTRLLEKEEIKLRQRRERLKILLEQEEEEFSQEIERKRQREECNYCAEKNKELQKYQVGLEKEKARECLKALEREKIAQGMRCTKEDEIRLKEMQKMQMEEKRQIENEEQTINAMWHHVLMKDYLRMTEIEQLNEQKRQQEMVERRRAYEVQIASANQKRRQVIREEIERENERLEMLRQKMEQDHYEEKQRKKQQQMTNKKNYLTSRDIKLSRLRTKKLNETEFDNNAIRRALEDLRHERETKWRQIHNLQVEKQICLENYKKQKEAAIAMDQESERIVREWKQNEQNKTDEYLTRIEQEQRISKEKAAKEYKDHIDNIYNKSIRAKEERFETMEGVKRTALKELQEKMHNANLELKKQMDYKNRLSKQIYENQNHLEMERKQIEIKDTPFTKKAMMFKDAMERKFKKYHNQPSTNPVHPFRRLMKSKEASSSVNLPLI